MRSLLHPSGDALTQKLTKTVKPIFHCKAKPLTLGLRVWLYPQRETFTLPLQTCWYLKTLAHPTRSPHIQHEPLHTQCNLQHESVEYKLRWVPSLCGSHWPCTYHVFFGQFHLRFVANVNTLSVGETDKAYIPL